MSSDRRQHGGEGGGRGTGRRSVLGGLAGGIMGAGLRPAAAQEAWFAPPPAGDTRPLALRFATNYVGVHPMGPAVRRRIAAFTAKYPHVSVAVEETPGNDHQTKIKLDASSNRVPDVFNYWRLDPGFGLDQIARAGKLADFSGWKAADPFFRGLFDDDAWRTASLDGKVYGIPALMFYVEFLANRAVFDRAGVAIPADWEGLLAAVKALKAKNELPWAISIGNDSEGGRIYNYVVNRSLGNERALRMHSGREPIDVPEMVQAMARLRELVVGYTPADAISITNDSVYAKYVNTNRGGLIIDGSWVTPSIKQSVQDNLVVLDFPLIPGGAQTQRNVERDLTSLWYASAQSVDDTARRPYVLELIRFLGSRDAARSYAEDANQQPAALGADIDEAKYGRVSKEAQKLATSAPANKWIPSVMTPTQRSQFEPALGQFLLGKTETAAFVSKLGTIFAAS